MAVEADIDADDQWFVGEDKLLRFTVDGGDGIEDWTLRWQLIDRKGVVVIEKVTGPDITVSDPAAFICQVRVRAEDTAGDPPLDDGVYQHTLWRTDAGFEALLSYGSAVLRSDRDA